MVGWNNTLLCVLNNLIPATQAPCICLQEDTLWILGVLCTHQAST